MKVLSITLLTDGPSDRALVPIVEWIVGNKISSYPFQVQMAHTSLGHSAGLRDRIEHAALHYPCDILVIHRDAEAAKPVLREKEIRDALSIINLNQTRAVSVIPVRMTEAWLLFDELAVRRAAGNPIGVKPIFLSTAKKWEQEIDPKLLLLTALREASELSGRRLAKFNAHEAKNRVADLIRDFSALSKLESFCAFQVKLEDALVGYTDQNLP